MHAKSLAEDVIEIAREAGRAILSIYDSDFDVETKDDDSPLTAADRAAHGIIVRELGSLTPEVPTWSEESAAIDYAERASWTRFWLVDPLDGTKEFIKRNGEFTVNIALIVEHEPVLGVVHVPVSGETFVGIAGDGALRINERNERRRIRVSENHADPVRIVGSRSHRGASLERFLSAIGPHAMVPMGSSLKFCLVAAGDADVYPRLGPTSEWDTAAAQAVVEAAGGHVVDLDGNRLRYNTRAEVLNPYFVVAGHECARWVNILREAR